jgi:uncharacterized protein
LKILIAISHPSHANFFKEAARILKREGNEIIISTLDRGRLVQIVDKEYAGFDRIVAGKHKGSRFSIILNVNIFRFFKFLKTSYANDIDLGLSVGSFTLGAALKLLFKPNVQFDDDPERKVNIFLEKLTSSKVYFPPVILPGKKINIFNALKEWSHLSPDYFKPDIEFLNEYGLKPKEYILVRDISTGSLNYMGQDPYIILKIAKDLPKEYKVVLSLETKSNFLKYPEDWIILNEPVMDFYSLLYYSKLVISSGDSIARESAMLGVPGIYCGFRKMKANEILIEKGMVFHCKPDEITGLVTKILNNEVSLIKQGEFRNELMSEWEDVTGLIVKIVNEYTKM